MMIARDTLLSPIEPAKATDQVIQRIAHAISSGVLKPGDQLPVEAELAAQLNVAQMTLRQALSILRDLGCIETVRGRNGGSFVSKRPDDIGGIFVGEIPTMDELQELTDYRMAIENEATALAAIRADRIAIAKIQIELDKCTEGASLGVDHWLVDNALHVTIAEASGSTRLVKAVTEIMHETAGFYQRTARPFEPILPHNAEHAALLAGIESRDPDKAWDASNQHLLSTHKFLESILLQLAS